MGIIYIKNSNKYIVLDNYVQDSTLNYLGRQDILFGYQDPFAKPQRRIVRCCTVLMISQPPHIAAVYNYDYTVFICIILISHANSLCQYIGGSTISHMRLPSRLSVFFFFFFFFFLWPETFKSAFWEQKSAPDREGRAPGLPPWICHCIRSAYLPKGFILSLSVTWIIYKELYTENISTLPPIYHIYLRGCCAVIYIEEMCIYQRRGKRIYRLKGCRLSNGGTLY